MIKRNAIPLTVALLLSGCASLGLADLVQPPSFSAAAGRASALRLLRPSAQMPLGGAALRLWTRVRNPNSFGINLAGMDGELYLENARAALVDLPLGLPLSAAQDTVIPIDLSVNLADLPRLAGQLADALGGGSIAYRLDGTVAVEAGAFGRQSFGPGTIMSGAVDVTRE